MQDQSINPPYIPGNLSNSGDLTKLSESIQSIIPIVLGVSAILSLIIFIYVLAASIHKWRVQAAILRIDKNLQKLVESTEYKNQSIAISSSTEEATIPSENK